MRVAIGGVLVGDNYGHKEEDAYPKAKEEAAEVWLVRDCTHPLLVQNVSRASRIQALSTPDNNGEAT